MTKIKKETRKHYLWFECIDKDSDSHTILFCSSSTKFEYLIMKKTEKLNRSFYWKKSHKIIFDLEKLRITEVEYFAKHVKCRDHTYESVHYNKPHFTDLLIMFFGNEYVSKFRIKYGIPHADDRCKRAWRGETLQDVLKNAKLPTTKSVVRTFGKALQDLPEIPRKTYHGEVFREGTKNVALPCLSLYQFIWYVSKDINELVKHIAISYRRSHIPLPHKPMSLQKMMFRKFYKNLDPNQKKTFNKNLFGDLRELDDTLRMIDALHININDMQLTDKTISGIHDGLILVRSRALDQERKFYDTVKFKQLPYLHNVELEGHIRLEYPENRAILEKYGTDHHHCVGSYFDRVKIGASIILGIYKNDKHTYTAEINVDTGTLVQMRGFGNDSRETLEKKLIRQCDEHIVKSYISKVCKENKLERDHVKLDPPPIDINLPLETEGQQRLPRFPINRQQRNAPVIDYDIEDEDVCVAHPIEADMGDAHSENFARTL